MLLDRCRLNDKVTALFEPRHARQYGGISFEIGRSMGGFVATSFNDWINISATFASWCQSKLLKLNENIRHVEKFASA